MGIGDWGLGIGDWGLGIGPKEPFKEGFRPLDDLPEFVEWFKASREK